VEAQAVHLLLSMQENYKPDPPVRPFATQEKLKSWQIQEKKRLAALRAQEPAPREWPYEGVYRVRGQVPPGYRVGGTAVVCWALMEAPGFARDKASQKAVAAGLNFIMQQSSTNPLLQSGFLGGYDVRGWAHDYGLFTLTRALELGLFRKPARRKRARKTIQRLIQALQETEIPVSGGWNYARGGRARHAAPSSFMTASTLLALFEARSQGFAVKKEVVERALKTLERGRAANGAILYAIGRGGPGGARVPGASARMAIAETALYLGGRGSLQHLRQAVLAFFQFWGELAKRRGKQGTHQGPYLIAPYYFYFGHTYAALAIELLPKQERALYRKKLRHLFQKTRDPDGGWNDRIFPRTEAYSTAMALLALNMPHVRPPAPWKPKAQKR